MVKTVFSTHEMAQLCNVHQTTIINWIKENKLRAYTTVGGHRRVKKEDFLDFLRQYHLPIPQALMPPSKKTVLIADDDNAMLLELKIALTPLDLNVEFATNGFEAGWKIHQTKPDLILLDFKMPYMDGFEVCRILQQHEDTAHIPIIAITGLKTAADIQKIKQCGVVEYFQKPFRVDKLLSKISKYLGLPVQPLAGVL